MKILIKIKTTIVLFTLLSINAYANEFEVSIKNKLDFDRKEVVSIKSKNLDCLLKGNNAKNLRIKKKGTNDFVVLQWIDFNADGISDELLFQADVPAKSTAQFVIVFDNAIPLTESKTTTFSRFVPERVDDYAWENDKVAFRTYGPQAQKNFEQSLPNPTLSSGVDLWLKKTDQPIIDKWYAGNTASAGYYHIDHGDGYDPYHVGASRGTGGTGIWENNKLEVSKNFVSYKTIATGPLRTIFELSYASWSAYGVKEIKRISLDLGSNFSKFEIDLNADISVPNFAAGITLHTNLGEAKTNEKSGWMAHSETIDGQLLCEGIVAKKSNIQKMFPNVSTEKDQSNLLMLTTPKNNMVTYYAGFAWQKSGQINTKEDWFSMLDQQAKIISNPLVVKIKKN